MDTESLRLFCDVIRLKSFTRAAATHYLTQSAASQRIKALEKDFGALLIERHGGELHLTSAGKIVFETAKRILTDLQDLEDNLTQLGGKSGDHVRVAAIYSVGLYELGPFVKKLLSRYPDIEVQIEYSNAKEIYQDVINGTVDLGMVAYPRNYPKIQSVVFREDELVLICHPRHPLCSSEPITFSTIAAEPFIAFRRDTPTRKSLDRIMREHGVSAKVKAEFDNIELIKRAVEIDLGISVVPSIPVMSEVRFGTLTALRLADGPFMRPIAAVYRRRRSLPPAVRNFIDVLTEKETGAL
ncbi:MAG: LysR family transcriptional regulator [Deltaproteobacteria bacterium]|nr:LysR family transcriptional regulator [Deltaproteobacteria bacterium]